VAVKTGNVALQLVLAKKILNVHEKSLQDRDQWKGLCDTLAAGMNHVLRN
jgi:hypothetical protein